MVLLPFPPPDPPFAPTPQPIPPPPPADVIDENIELDPDDVVGMDVALAAPAQLLLGNLLL